LAFHTFFGMLCRGGARGFSKEPPNAMFARLASCVAGVCAVRRVRSSVAAPSSPTSSQQHPDTFAYQAPARPSTASTDTHGLVYLQPRRRLAVVEQRRIARARHERLPIAHGVLPRSASASASTLLRRQRRRLRPHCQTTGFGLHAGCQDIYGAGFNGGTTRSAALRHRSLRQHVLDIPTGTGDAIWRHVQIPSPTWTPSPTRRAVLRRGRVRLPRRPSPTS